jgi:hypothetical protein
MLAESAILYYDTSGVKEVRFDKVLEMNYLPSKGKGDILGGFGDEKKKKSSKSEKEEPAAAVEEEKQVLPDPGEVITPRKELSPPAE